MSALSLFDADQHPYMGVGADLNYITGGGVLPERSSGNAGMVALCLIDLPFSLVGDTILLPYSSFMYVKNHSGQPPCHASANDSEDRSKASSTTVVTDKNCSQK